MTRAQRQALVAGESLAIRYAPSHAESPGNASWLCHDLRCKARCRRVFQSEKTLLTLKYTEQRTAQIRIIGTQRVLLTMLAHFFSPDTTARIEPAEFMTHLLSHHGLDIDSLGLRQTVVLAFIPELERRLLRTLGSPPPHPHKIQRQTLYNPKDCPFSVLSSPMGAPMAVMLLEQLIALGACHFLYVGFCGALHASYRIGDGFIPQHAIREEGTSYHYLPAEVVPTSSWRLNTVLQAHADAKALSVRQGPVWTTDAPYRETAHKIRHFQAAGVHAVDMEMAALFAVAQHRGCEVAALLLVSDECYHPIWKPGFGSQRLRQACQDAVEVCVAAATSIASGNPY